MKLYEIAQQYRADLEALADLDVCDPQTVTDTLESLQGDLHDKLRAVIAYSLELSILSAGADDAAKRMKARATALESRSESLRRYALDAMQATGTQQISTDEWAAKVAKTPPKVVIEDGADLPAEYRRVKTIIEPDKTAIKAAIESGAEIAGVSLQSGFRLAIK